MPLKSDPNVSVQDGVFRALLSLRSRFWFGCTIEMCERLAWSTMRSMLPIYICQADEAGGLHFTQAEKGTIYAWWALLQGMLPTLCGALADRYGKKRMLRLYALIHVAAFVLMAHVRSFPGFFATCLLLGVGTATFKPALQATLADAMSPRNESLGWGVFYWLVNVGSMLGPPLASGLHRWGWPSLFYTCAAITSLNLVLLLFGSAEEARPEKTSRGAGDVWAFPELKDARLVALIVLFGSLWMMLYQLWDFMPNYYADWIDSRSIRPYLSWLPSSWTQDSAGGPSLKQENALNLNTLLVVLFVVPVAHLVKQMRPLSAISTGVVFATGGVFVFGLSRDVAVLFGGLLLFSMGEMLIGPRTTHYFSRIAPPGQTARYLGYVHVPMALGQFVGATLAGSYYGSNGEKATLALRYLAERTGLWTGDVSQLESFVGVSRRDAFATLVATVGHDASRANQLLWDTYHPYRIWYLFSVVGLFSLVGLLLFDRVGARTQRGG